MAEAASKRSNSKVGGNYDQYSNRFETKVGPKVLTTADALRMWCAVPLSSKLGTFSHSLGRIEMWRGGIRFDLSVAAPFVWRCPGNRTVAPFPHPAHRTGHADFPHPAVGQDTYLHTRKVIRSSSAHRWSCATPAYIERVFCSQPPMPPPGRSFAFRIEIRVLPSLQHVAPSAAPAP